MEKLQIPSTSLQVRNPSPTEGHSQGDNLSFADGHVEHRRWHRAITSYSEERVLVRNPADQQNIEWLQDRIPKSP